MRPLNYAHMILAYMGMPRFFLGDWWLYLVINYLSQFRHGMMNIYRVLLTFHRATIALGCFKGSQDNAEIKLLDIK